MEHNMEYNMEHNMGMSISLQKFLTHSFVLYIHTDGRLLQEGQIQIMMEAKPIGYRGGISQKIQPFSALTNPRLPMKKYGRTGHQKMNTITGVMSMIQMMKMILKVNIHRWMSFIDTEHWNSCRWML